MPTYLIVRRYQRSSERSAIIDRGLTLEAAQAHCQDPETSSATCTCPTGHRHTAQKGAWFDSYTKEDRD